MAEQSNVVSTVVDKITAYFTKEDGTCSVDVQKFQAMVSIRKCNSKTNCWTTIACQQEVSIPTVDREMIEVTDTDNCSLFDTDSSSWKEFVPDTTRFMDEFSQELYYNTSRLDAIVSAHGTNIPYIVLIEVNDLRKTQFAFKAHLKSYGATFVSNEDASVSMIPVTWQPTGKPRVTSGVTVSYCA